MAGWVLLAIGAYHSGTLGLFRSVALASMFSLPLGTLKGTRFESTFLILGLCIALVPPGIKVLLDGPSPSRKAIIWTSVFVGGQIIFIALSILFPEIMQH